MNPRVDEVLGKAKKWKEEINKLRRIAIDCLLTEELKWGKPCYSFGKGNVAIIFGFKDYCAIGFFKGTLLRDDAGILVGPGDNSQAMRQIRFKSTKDIVEKEALVKAYIFEAIEVEKAGLKVNFNKTTEYSIPEEFETLLNGNISVKKAFNALTPGRQRAYLLYFSQPKQSATRINRIEKCLPAILTGKGLND